MWWYLTSGSGAILISHNHLLDGPGGVRGPAPRTRYRSPGHRPVSEVHDHDRDYPDHLLWGRLTMARTRSSTPPLGTAWKSGDRWRARLEWRKPDGTTVRKTFTADTKREAMDRLGEYRRGLLDGLRPDSATFDQVADQHLEAMERRARPRSVANVRAHLARVRPVLGSLAVSAITPAHVERAMAQADGLRPQTARHVLRSTRAVLSRAVKHGYAVRNVADAVALPKPDRYRPDLPRPAEVAAVLDELREHGAGSWPILWALSATGARFGEVAGLRWSDVDRDAGTVTIAGQADRDGNYTKPKTPAAYRTLPIGPRLTAALDAAEASRGRAKVASVYVFARPTGEPWSSATARLHWKGAQVRVWGTERMRVHDLRHLMASSLLADGVPLPDVSRHLGHASPAMTASLYTWALPDSRERVTAALVATGLG